MFRIATWVRCFYIFIVNTIIQQGCTELIKSGSKDLSKNYISNKCCSFELSIHQNILKKEAQPFSTLIIFKTKYCLSSKLAHYNDFVKDQIQRNTF